MQSCHSLEKKKYKVSEEHANIVVGIKETEEIHLGGKERNLKKGEEETQLINDSLIEFVVQDVSSISESYTECIKSDIQQNGNNRARSISRESSVPLGSEEDSESSSGQGRRCSRRIQKNKELAEARRIEIAQAIEQEAAASPSQERNKKYGSLDNTLVAADKKGDVT